MSTAILIYTLAVLALAGGMLAVSWLLSPRHREAATGEPYESGIRPTGDARVRLSVTYFLMAMFFVLFDLEAVYLFAWAVSARAVGWAGLAEAGVFAGVLLAALVYLARAGALDPGAGIALAAREAQDPSDAPAQEAP